MCATAKRVFHRNLSLVSAGRPWPRRHRRVGCDGGGGALSNRCEKRRYINTNNVRHGRPVRVKFAYLIGQEKRGLPHLPETFSVRSENGRTVGCVSKSLKKKTKKSIILIIIMIGSMQIQPPIERVGTTACRWPTQNLCNLLRSSRSNSNGIVDSRNKNTTLLCHSHSNNSPEQ